MTEDIRTLNGREIKEYIENLALNFLKNYDYDTYKDFSIKDAPDIQAIDLKNGIEVTQAISKNIAQIDAEYVRYRDKDKTNEKSYHLKLIEINGATIDDDILSYPVSNEKDESEIISHTIEHKLNKISAYKKKGFSKLSLFVVITWMPIPTVLVELKKYLDKLVESNTDMYDTIFISYPAAIYIYDSKNKTYSIHKIDDYEGIKKETYLNVTKMCKTL